MLMENREEISHGLKTVEKSGSLDPEKVYKRSSGSISGRNDVLKRKLDLEDKNGDRKKRKKEVLINSLSSAKEKQNKVSSGQVGKCQSSSVSLGSSNGEVGSDCGSGAGISLKLNVDVNVPKRPRDFVRRKKVEVDLMSKVGGISDGLNVNGNGNFHDHGKSNGEFDENGECEGALSDGEIMKLKKNKKIDDHEENRTTQSEMIPSVKRENSHSSLNNGDSVVKKARRNRKKVKETRPEDVRVSKEVVQSFNEPIRIDVESQDDEENLEANAARMLSSRFDPRCTGFSSGGKSSIIPFTNRISAMNSSESDFDISHPICLEESDVAPSDGEAKDIRSRVQEKGKGNLKQRRYFYEVLPGDLDSYWVVNRRIKVFWPLDKSWYYGHVIGYNPEKKLHHVKYDDHEEEWIDLRNERFKLLLLPSEVPGKVARKQSVTQDKPSGAVKSDNKEHNSCNSMDSEPIISWLGRSTFHKSQPVGIRKKQKTLQDTATIALPLDCDEKSKPIGSMKVGCSGQDVGNTVNGSALLVDPDVFTSEIKLPEKKVASSSKRSPIVYFRKRFQKKSHQPSDIHVEDLCHLPKEIPVCGTDSGNVDSLEFGADMLQSMVKCGHSHETLCSKEFIWDTDCLGHLKLIIPATSLKVFSFQLSFPLPFVDTSLFGGHDFMFMLQHVALIPVWPMIRLEIMFVDNTVGLRIFLFEGCLMQALSFVFLVLVVFRTNQKENYVCQQLPSTSIRFQFSGLQSLEKQHIFTSYNFTEVLSSKWSYIDRKLSTHCVLSKQLPPSACTYNNILALRNGCQLPLASVSQKHSSIMSVQTRSRQQRMSKPLKQSSFEKLRQVSSDSNEELPPLALSFAATPTFFVSLHLKLLMERSISSSTLHDHDSVFATSCLNDSKSVFPTNRFDSEDHPMSAAVSVTVSSRALLSSKLDLESLDPAVNTYHSCDLHESDVEMHKSDKSVCPVTESMDHVMLVEQFSADNQLSPVETKVECGLNAKLTIEIPSLISSESVVDADVQNLQQSADLSVLSNDDPTHSPVPTPQSFLHSRGIDDFSPSASACPSPGWSDRKQGFLHSGFGNGPKKPRTQVSYSMPHGGDDYNSNNKFQNGKSVSHKRIRKANEKRTSEAFVSSKRNVELLSCDVNILITVGDRGWRECGARVMLEHVDHNEWRLAVKVSGETKYSYKAHQFLQPGSTNRYTHAMMWKGGKDWILEFTDRSQWTTFKEILEECFNRNIRAASVKNIPIPGVHLIEENDDVVPEVPYMRPSSKYYRQLETDIDIAMNPSRVLYDMDSDDEQWVMKHRGLDFNEGGCGDISDEMFEKTMDAFEKLAYVKQHDHFSLDELEEAMASFGPLDAIIIIYNHWREKRQRKGMPLIRHLQPPLWKKYQQQVKEWEQVVPRSNPIPSSGCLEKPSIVEKPAMFAFCLKPRGLEVHNRVSSKHRSQKKLPVAVLSNGVPGDPDSSHSLVGRRTNGFALGDDRLGYNAYSQGASDTSPVLQGSSRVLSPRYTRGMGYFSLNNDGFERNYYSKPFKNKSKKLCITPPYNDQFASHSPRFMDSLEFPSQMNYPSDGYQRRSSNQLDPSELDEFRLRDAASAARHATKIAKIKRENAQRMLCRADLAMHKAVAAIMTAEAVKDSYVGPNDDDIQMTE